MVKENSALKQLAQWSVPEFDGDETALQVRVNPAIKKLPAALRPIAYAAYGFNEKGDVTDWYTYRDLDLKKRQAEQAKLSKLQQQFDKLSAAERKKIFAALGSQLAEPLELAWQFLKSAPYKSGYSPTPFRAPNNPELTLTTRLRWLEEFAQAASEYQADVMTPQWLAAWAKHAFDYNADCVSPLLIAVMNKKGNVGDEVFDILYKTVTREHSTAVMAGFVIESLLGAERREGWELIEKTLLAAQRQEGLRQTIVSAADLAHPEAFRRILRLIVDEDLIRFSSVARAVDVWLRLLWDSASTKILEENVEAIILFMESPKDHKQGLASDDAETVYRALWVAAQRDAVATVKLAKEKLRHKSDEIRYVAVWILTQLGIKQAAAAKADAIDDSNLQVAVLAACGLSGLSGESEVLESLTESSDDDDDEAATKATDAFEKIEALFQRLPQKAETLKAIVWPWTVRKIKQADISDQLLETLGERPPTRILPYLKGLSAWEQSEVVRLLAKQKKWDAVTRSTLLGLAGHASADVREAVFQALEKHPLDDNEHLILEDYLTRSSADLRNGVITKILTQKDPKALASGSRLLAAKDAKKRLAGLEVLRRMAEADRSRDECQQMAANFQAERKGLTKDEQVQVKEIAVSGRKQWSFDNGLGLMNPEKITPVRLPTKKKVPLITKAAIECLKSLDELVHQHRSEKIRYQRWGEWREPLLGEVDYGLPNLNLQKPLDRQLAHFPLWEIWSQWRANRPAKLKDKDGLELLRAVVACSSLGDYDYEDIRRFAKKPEQKKIAIAILGEFDPPKFRYFNVVESIAEWLLYSELPAGTVDYLLDCMENTGAHVTPQMQADLVAANDGSHYDSWDDDVKDWRNNGVFKVWPDFLRGYLRRTQIKTTAPQRRRLYELERFWDEPAPGAQRERQSVEDILQAYQEKIATFDDVVDNLIGPGHGGYDAFSSLAQLTRRNPSKSIAALIAQSNGVPELIDNIRRTLLEIELSRGEHATIASTAALAVDTYDGSETLFQILAALDGKFKVLSGWNAETKDSRPATFTALVKATYPRDDESFSHFRKHAEQAIEEGYFSEEQLLDLAFLAPQWSKFAGELLNWEGFSEGLYWFLAHMNTWMSDATEAAAMAEGMVDDDDDQDDDDDDFDPVDSGDDDTQEEKEAVKLSAWQRLILERTPLTPQERSDGAVDVDWFHRTYKILGDQRWRRMAECAKLAANASQAKKAQFLADVLLGNTARKELIDGIKKRNLKEYVRLLGLLPLAAGNKRDADIMERYEVLIGYKKYANTLSSLTKPAALRAYEIGISNLARLAGYADPLRLEWALEAESIKDLAKGPISVTKDGVTLVLQLNEDALPELSVRRGDKPLKSLPAPIRKKHAAMAELSDRAKDLKKKASRMKQSLEQAMCRGDAILGSELLQLMEHAILAPQLKRLVLVGDGIAGYPDKSGKVLRNYDGKLEPVKKNESLRIAHPVDLLALGDWVKWQHECYQAERVQPFKQIFRELYIPTKQEKNSVEATRFSGHQIGPKQAMALWNARGWNTQEEVIRVFHDLSLIAGVSFQRDWGTAAEVEGLTVQDVTFLKRDAYQKLKLKDVPPIIFSEVLRDIDLVVSVAHRGEVDPEASESTVEMRMTLIKETCQLLGLKNVKFKSPHVIIDGHYGEYSLHLGSGGIHRLPGGALAIVPVHAQHRGRLFLPFADNDPKTAEVVSKVLLLAKDEEILDPTILDQLGAPVKERSRSAVSEDQGQRASSDAKQSKSKRRFEFTEGSSNKFWEIELSGDSVTTRWGRIGSNGQTKAKTFTSDAKAKENYEALISEKTSKGYTEIS